MACDPKVVSKNRFFVCKGTGALPVTSLPQKEKTLLTALSNFGNSSSVRFLCYRNIFLFNGYCKNVSNPLPKNNGNCLEPS